MPEHIRQSAEVSSKKKLGNGIYSARIVNNLDPTYMGCLEVTLMKPQGNQVGNTMQSYIVKYAPPFFGYTASEHTGNNTSEKTDAISGFNDTQKSYGMWFVPPDIGVTVLVVFVDGDSSQGYWFAAVPSRFTNHMVPAIAGSSSVDVSSSDKTAFDTKSPLPVAEINKRSNTTTDKEIDASKMKKALHPMAACYLEQGLVEDSIRGVTNSSSRREAPSMVFGISTPGPVDRRKGSKMATVGTAQSQSKSAIPVSRIGGTQFVMDDGQDKLQRKTHASVGKMQYEDITKTGKGSLNIPYNEYFRVRTRTGHQILMHNSEDLIYIANSRGTAWVELTSNGKIDIYSQDSISIHTENDLNIRADRDINLEAGRNFNVCAGADTGLGGIQMESAGNTSLVIGASGQITTVSDFELISGKTNKFTAGSSTHVNSKTSHSITADQIYMNCDKSVAAKAAPAQPFQIHDIPVTSTKVAWKKERYQVKKPLQSILRRIPMHEPWALHENLDPTAVVPDKTDISKGGKKRGK
jgi:hypothetical protein